MLRFLLFVVLLVSCNSLFAQQNQLYKLIHAYKQKNKFSSTATWWLDGKTNTIAVPSLRNTIETQWLVTPNKQALVNCYQLKEKAIEVALTMAENKTIVLELLQADITNGHPLIANIFQESGLAQMPLKPALHYRGIIQNQPNTLAAITLFEDGELMAVVTDSSANYVIGKIAGTNQISIHNSLHLPLPDGFQCGVIDEVPAINGDKFYTQPDQSTAASMLCKKVRCYWETNYNLYRYTMDANLGNLSNYINGLFNIVATLYLNEGIQIELSGLGIWTTSDPYRTASSNFGLDDFKRRWNAQSNDFDGDIAHLIAGGPTNNGGLGYVGVLCNKYYAYSYSNVWGTYANLPTWSWDANVVTHEMGHNLGSKHTHWCGWNTGASGTCGAIDNCSTVEAAGSCSTCSSTYNISALPAGWKGTIMSYCHNVSGVGINLSNGFGPLPQFAIRSNVSTSSCLASINYWSGITDSVWSRSSNWNCSNIPDSTTDVTIPAGTTHPPVITNTAYAGSIIVASGTTLKIKQPGSLRVKKPVSPMVNQVNMPASGNLYITGSATPGGWMSNGDPALPNQQLIQAGNRMYIGRSFLLTGGSNYLLVPVYGNWNNKYGYTGTANSNAPLYYNFMAEGSDIGGPTTTGYYDLFADFGNGTVTLNTANAKVTTPASNELYITGNATPGGWMVAGAAALLSQQFTRVSTTLYELPSIYLTAGNSYLFVPVYGSWSTKYGAVDRLNNLNQPMEDYFQMRGSDLKAPAVSGNYKIVVDFQTGKYTLTLL